MLTIFNHTMTLKEALTKYDNSIVYSIYYSSPERQRQLLLNFGDKTDGEDELREQMKEVELREIVDISKDSYVYISGKISPLPKDTIKMMRPLYNLLEMGNGLFKEDLPHVYFVHYRLHVKDGLRFFYDPEGYVMVVMDHWNRVDDARKALNL